MIGKWLKIYNIKNWLNIVCRCENLIVYENIFRWKKINILWDIKSM